MSQQAFAALVGRDRTTIRSWQLAGMPVEERSGPGHTHRVPLGPALRWLVERLEARVEEAEASADPGLTDARRAKLEHEGALLRMRVEREQGEFLRRADVVATGAAVVTAWSAMLRRMPREAVQRGVIRLEQEPGLARLVRDIQTAIATSRQLETGPDFDVERLAPEYWPASELQARLDDPHRWPGMLGAANALHRQLSDLAARGIGIVTYRSGGWQEWPLQGGVHSAERSQS